MSTPAPDTAAPTDWLDAVRWDAAGLVTAIAQEAGSGRILMVAWMNREALAQTVHTGRAVYWSRSRARLCARVERLGLHGRPVVRGAAPPRSRRRRSLRLRGPHAVSAGSHLGGARPSASNASTNAASIVSPP